MNACRVTVQNYDGGASDKGPEYLIATALSKASYSNANLILCLPFGNARTTTNGRQGAALIGRMACWYKEVDKVSG